jgi:S-adenosylmethionine uptake transporter
MTIPTTPDSREHRPFRGIALSVFGMGCITFNDSMMKLVVNDHPIGQAIFIRGIFVLLLISLLVYRQGGFRVLRIHSMRLQLWSAILLVFPVFLFIYALSQLPLSIATIIFFTNPLFVCLFASIGFSRRAGIRRRGACFEPDFERIRMGSAGATHCGVVVRSPRTCAPSGDGK